MPVEEQITWDAPVAEQGIKWDAPVKAQADESGIKWDAAPADQGIKWDSQPDTPPNLTLAPESVQGLPGTPVAPGMPTSVREVAPQGLNERGQAVLLSPETLYKGIPEAGANVATGVAGFITKGVYQPLNTLALTLSGHPDPVGEAKKTGEKIAEWMTYQPASASGKELAGFAGGVMNAPFEAIRTGLEATHMPQQYQDAVMEGILSGLALTGAAKMAKVGPKAPTEVPGKVDWNSFLDEVAKEHERTSTEAAPAAVNGKPTAPTEGLDLTGLEPSPKAAEMATQPEPGVPAETVPAGELMPYAEDVIPSDGPVVPGHIERAVKDARTVDVDVAVQTKQLTKDSLMEHLSSGSIPPGSPVRLTTVDEIRSIIKNGRLSSGLDFEGRSGISAQQIDGNKPIVAYGANDKISAAVVFPESSVVGKGVQPNEVKINEGTSLRDVRFVVDGYKELMTADELVKIINPKDGQGSVKLKPPVTETIAEPSDLPPAGLPKEPQGGVPPVEPPVKKVSETVAPEGLGNERIRGVAKNIESDAIRNELIKNRGELGELPKYTLEDAGKTEQKITKLLDEDYERAIRVVEGKESPPEGLRAEEVFTAVRIRARLRGDSETLRNMLDSPVITAATEKGRSIQALDSGADISDPFNAMQDVAKARAERAKRTGETPATVAKIQELTGKLDEATKRLTAYEEAASKKHAARIVDEIKQEINRESRRTSRTASKAVLDEEFSGLTKQLSRILNPNKLSAGIDPAVVPVFLKMAKNRIRSGIITVEGVVDSVYHAVKGMMDVTKREVRDAISGYGKTAKMSKDEINVRLRELNRQARLISALEDAKTGKAPLRSGLQRDAVSNDVRELQKKVKQAMRESGIDSEITRTPEAQFKSALDAVKTRLRNQIFDLEKQLKTGEKTPRKIGIEYDKEANTLKVERDNLRAMLQEIEGKPEMSQAQRTKNATSAVEKSISELVRRMSENDLNPQKKVSATQETPELAMMRSFRDDMKGYFKKMQDAAKAPKDPEAIKLKTFKTRTANEITKLEKKLADGDFTKPGEKSTTHLDTEGNRLKAERDRIKEDYKNAQKAGVTKEEAAEIVRLSKVTAEKRAAIDQGGERLDYGASRVAYENYVNDLKGENTPIKSMLKDRAAEFKTTWKDNKSRAVWEMSKDTIKTITDNSIAMVASLDNSFIGRQGLKTLMTHPSAWWPASKKSFSDFANTIGGKNAHDALNADVYSRPNYLNGEYQRAKIITRTEEQFPTTLPERVPVLGRVFKASEVAFTGSGLRMRTDLYDLLSKRAKENGVDMTNKTQAESLGKMINSLTARGQWGTRGDNAVVRLVLWAPKMLKGNIDVLTAHGFGSGLESAFARKEAAVNLLKIVAETATVMAIANALSPGSAELDLRSSDFGKIKVGDTRFDITGGAGSIVVLASRIITNSSKSTSTGLVTPYGIGYGKRTAFDALIDFLNNKTTPAAGVVTQWLKGKNRTGEPFTVGKAAYGAFTPIALQNFINLKDDISADKVAGAIVDLVGINANSYSDNNDKRGDIVDRMRKGKTLTDSQQEMFNNSTPEQKRTIRNDSKISATRSAFNKMSIQESVSAWDNASAEQKMSLRSAMMMKISNAKITPQEKRAIREKVY